MKILSLRDRIARSIFWLTWSRGVLQLLSFATTLLVARILEPADYGVMALAAIWIGTAGMLAEMGLASAIIQFRDLDKREIDTCFWIAVMLATGCAAILFLSAPEIAAWFAMPRLAQISACIVASAAGDRMPRRLRPACCAKIWHSTRYRKPK